MDRWNLLKYNVNGKRHERPNSMGHLRSSSSSSGGSGGDSIARKQRSMRIRRQLLQKSLDSTAIADRFDEVTVLFTDLQNFTSWHASHLFHRTARTRSAPSQIHEPRASRNHCPSTPEAPRRFQAEPMTARRVLHLTLSGALHSRGGRSVSLLSSNSNTFSL